MELESLYNIVNEILRTDHQSRNNDNRLIWKVAEVLGLITTSEAGYSYIMEEDFNRIKFESIRRIRQKIQNEEHRFKAEEDVEQMRASYRQDIKEFVLQ